MHKKAFLVFSVSMVLTDSRQFQHLQIAPSLSLYTISPSYGGSLLSVPNTTKFSFPTALVNLISPTNVSISSPPQGSAYLNETEL